jgi:hypothetical protein
MSITSNVTQTHLTRTIVWQDQIKEQLQENLMGKSYINWMPDVDGDEWSIPSIGEATIRDYVEDTDIVFDSLDTGEFRFTVTEYNSAGLYITKKARQNSFYAAKLEASFVPKMVRAFDEVIETRIFALADPVRSIGTHTQTANSANTINGAEHRWAATGNVLGNNADLQLQDFAKALFSLKKANVPDTNLVAFVDPSTELAMNLNTQIVALTNDNQRWDNIVEEGISSGTKFLKNIYGFDVYSTNFLSPSTAAEGSLTGASSAGDVQNIFCSLAGGDINPFIGAWRQAPEVESEYVMRRQREEYVLTARYGLDLYRPENLVVVLTNPTVSI